MKILKKQELQQIVFNHSSDIDFRDFMNLYKKCTEKQYSFLVIDATLLFLVIDATINNPLSFRQKPNLHIFL